MKSKKPKIVAAFDFDRTLTTKDTFLPFLFHSFGYFKTLSKLARELPSVVLYGLKKLSHQKAKEKILTRFYKGSSFESLKKEAELFGIEKLPRYLAAKAVNRLNWHLNQEHLVILISASLEIYLRPLKKHLGIHQILASRLEVDKDGKITGNFLGSNCRGKEKVSRLIELLGPKENYELYAYGDNEGDRELLQLADHSYYRMMPSTEEKITYPTSC